MPWRWLSALPVLLVTLLAYGAIHHLGNPTNGPSAVAMPPATDAPAHDLVARVLLALATIMIAARIVGETGKRWLGQPPVIGEILAGILLGPSCLGAVSPALSQFLLPPSIAPSLGMISQLGVILFMFVVGLELDPGLIRANTARIVSISYAGIAVPFLGGAALSGLLYPHYAGAQVSFTSFSLFFGAALSVTAFPVLARILTDRGLQATPLGTMALACAAADDVAAWCLLAVVVGVATTGLATPATTAALVAVYVLAMTTLVRPFYQRLAAREEVTRRDLSRNTLAWVFAGLLLSAAATDWIGIHPLFGAFFFGAMLPQEGRLAQQLRTRVEDMVIVLFLPAFFAFTGMRTEISLIESSRDWMFCALIIVNATAGKFGGVFATAWWNGVPPRDSAALGVLMNTRGLMELIVLNVGLDLGVISPRLFAMMVTMALVTTIATSPLFDLLMRPLARGEVRAGRHA